MAEEVKPNESEPESDDDTALKEKFTRWLGEIAAEAGPPPEAPSKAPSKGNQEPLGASQGSSLDAWFERKMQEREQQAKAKEKETSLLSRLEQLEQKVNTKRRKRGVYSPFGG